MGIIQKNLLVVLGFQKVSKKGVVAMAIASTDDIYESIFSTLLIYMLSNNNETYLKNKDTVKIEIKRFVNKELCKIIAGMLRNLYGSDYDSLERDMAKITLLGGKIPDDRITVLKLIWSNVSDCFDGSPEELISKLKLV